MTKQAERHRKLKDESRGVDKCGPKWPGRGPKRASDRPETLGHDSAATRFVCGAGDGNRSRTVSLGTDSLQGRSRRWLMARVVARVPFRTRMSADLLKKNSRIRLCCNAFRVWSG